MNQDYLLPTNDIREIKDLHLEPIDLINNGQCTAYYAVVIYVEDEIIYIENNRLPFLSDSTVYFYTSGFQLNPQNEGQYEQLQ